jgi:hypothetical protein
MGLGTWLGFTNGLMDCTSSKLGNGITCVFRNVLTSIHFHTLLSPKQPQIYPFNSIASLQAWS